MQARELPEETSFSFSTEAPRPSERRRDRRYLTILRVGTLIVDGRRELCLVRNISAGGLMAHVYSSYATGVRVSVELKTNQQIQGTVTWTEGANMGIGFDEPADVAELLNNPPRLENGWLPRLPRVEVDRLATLRIGGHFHWVTAIDISQGGVKIETDRPIEPGVEAVLTFDGMRPIAGVVRWHHDGVAGVSFNQVLPFGELVAWLKPQQ
jgi:hypothetical protein